MIEPAKFHNDVMGLSPNVREIFAAFHFDDAIMIGGLTQ